MTGYTLRQSCILFLTALIWGVAFVAQSAGMEYLGPFTYNGVRSVLGGLVLLPCIALLDRIQGRQSGGGNRQYTGSEPKWAGTGRRGGRQKTAVDRRFVLRDRSVCGQ